RLTENAITNNKAHSDANSDKKSNVIYGNNIPKNKNNIAGTETNAKIEKTDSSRDFDQTKTENQLQKTNKNATENGVALEENTEVEIEKPVEESLIKTNLTIEEAIA